jgi:integrase/recombinase XerD
MQEIRRFKPSTMSRRFSVTAGFYRTCAIDAVIEHSPAEHVRRPAVPAESPTLGFTHLQSEALLTAARESPGPSDFALVAMLGLLGLRIYADPRTTVRYERARQNLDRHPNYILAAYMASGT